MHKSSLLAFLLFPVLLLSQAPATSPKGDPELLTIPDSKSSWSDLTGVTVQRLVTEGKFADAEQEVRKYLKDHPNSPDAHYQLGYILFKLQKAEPSLAEYTQGARFRKPTAYDLEVVACDYVLLGDFPDADKWFTKSLEWNPTNAGALYYLGRAKYNENRFDEAIKSFTDTLKLDPRNVKAEDNLGLSYEGLGRTEEAITAYKTAISWQADSFAKQAGPYLNLGTLLVEQNRTEEALGYLQEAVRIAPDDARTHRQLGKAYLHVNQFDQAQSELSAAVQLAPKDAPTHFMLSQVYRKLQQPDKAKAENDLYKSLTGEHTAPDAPRK